MGEESAFGEGVRVEGCVFCEGVRRERHVFCDEEESFCCVEVCDRESDASFSFCAFFWSVLFLPQPSI